MNERAKKIGALAIRALFRNDVEAGNDAIIEYGHLVEEEDRIDAQLDKRSIPAIAVATRIKSVTQSIKQIGRYYIIAAEAMINRSVETSTDIAEVISEE